YTPKPVTGYLGVAVEQYHVALRVQQHATIDRGNKTSVSFIVQQGNPVTLGSKPGHQLRVRAGIFDYDDFRLNRKLIGQDAFDALSSLFVAPVNRNDDVDLRQ